MNVRIHQHSDGRWVVVGEARVTGLDGVTSFDVRKFWSGEVWTDNPALAVNFNAPALAEEYVDTHRPRFRVHWSAEPQPLTH